MNGILLDLRSGARRLLRNRGLTVVALLSLAVGIGANVAITSVASAVLVRPLPYEAPEDLVMIWRALTTPSSLPGYEHRRFYTRRASTAEMVQRWWEQGLPFADVAVFESWQTNLAATVNIIDDTSVERLRGVRAMANLFRMLGVNAARGRTFVDGETGVTVISDRLWRRRFGGSPDVVGQRVTLAQSRDRTPTSFEIIGVMPPDFHFTYPDETEIWVPLVRSDIHDAIQFAKFYQLMGRLRPDMPIQEAEAAMRAFDSPEAGWQVWLEPVQDYAVKHSRAGLALVSVLAGLVLVIGAVNAATVFLASAVSRLRDTRVRRALGASERRLFRQAFAEVAIVAIVAGALGLLTVVVALPVMRALLPSTLPRLDEIRLDGLTLASVSVAVIVATLLAGIFPAWLATRERDVRSLEDGPTATTSRAGLRLRVGLLTAQFALVTVLLVAGGMVIHAFWNVVTVDKGFQVDERLHVAELPIWGDSAVRPYYETFERELVQQAREIPYAEAVSVASVLPLFGIDPPASLKQPDGRTILASHRNVDTGYFDVMRIPILAGRPFRDDDARATQSVAIVSKRLAEMLYPGESPIGRILSDNIYARIIGVVGDVRSRSLVERPLPAFYMPRESPRLSNIYLLLRSQASAAQVATDIRGIVHRLAPEQAVRFTTVADIFSRETEDRRTSAVIAGAFAVTMLLLSGLGLCGHLSHVVVERTRELAIRSALGASARRQVRDLVHYLLPALGGGVAAAMLTIYLAYPFIAPFLFQVDRIDPLVWGVGVVLMAAFSAAAIVIPARRMVRLDAAAALRAS